MNKTNSNMNSNKKKAEKKGKGKRKSRKKGGKRVKEWSKINSHNRTQKMIQ